MAEFLDIHVEHIQRGQAGNYAPHRYEARITFSSARPWNLPTEQAVRKLAKTLVHHWPEDDEREPGMGGHFQGHLRFLTRVEEERASDLGPRREVWHVCVEVPYCD